MLAVIKANAYGHGLVEVAGILEEADAFGVARFDEAVQLRAAGIRKRLVVLGGVLTAEEWRGAGQLHLDLVVHSPAQVDLMEATPLGSPLSCWLKVDTGMGRLGIDPATLPEILGRLAACVSVGSVILMTHLASADDASNPATRAQLKSFSHLLTYWRGDVSVANSAGILQWPDILVSGVGLPYGGNIGCGLESCSLGLPPP